MIRLTVEETNISFAVNRDITVTVKELEALFMQTF